MREFAERALDAAQAAGASFADVRIEEREVQSISVKNGRVDSLMTRATQGFGVRVLAEGCWGFAACATLSGPEIDRAAALAVRIARASALTRRVEVGLGPPVAARGLFRTPLAIDPFTIPLEAKIDLLLEADEAMRRVVGSSPLRAVAGSQEGGRQLASWAPRPAPGPAWPDRRQAQPGPPGARPSLVTEGSLGCQRVRKTYASTEGSFIEQDLIETGAGLVATAVGEGEVQKRSFPNSFGRHQGTGGWELVQAMQLVENAPRIAEEAVALLSASQCPSEVTTVIIDPTQMALQVHESCGHAVELDRVFGMEASYAGTSFLTPEKRGLRYGSEHVNIVADGTAPTGLGTYGWDDEGVAASVTPLVERGEFVGYLSSRETAAQLGLPSSGAARASGWNRIPLVRMTNINLRPGDWALKDLIADTEHGLYLETNRSWSIDDKRLNFQFGTEIAWEIEHGKLGRMLKNPTYGGMTTEFWGSCDAVCREWALWGTTNCGKGQPGQTMHVGHGTAAARFRNVRLGIA